ncbi:LysR family transcriptional regulator [Pararhodospirillum oryzae]|uniref:HTH-type transcriptional regulator MetR n=1 Tax=Pararhodospirillum oryzae TaxID=478448 RepID=A0A512H5F2_9PROT|nr:LysR family transcriptional regulator [Pararhodospirillum oryzae]GEO80706.1 LysR family transcriptional regulator [Pararhodospirillum oryzae]
MRLEVRTLRLILALDEGGSLAAAAERLHVTPSALSHQIKALEQDLGLAVFQRGSKPLRLSPAGGRLLAFARRIVPEFQAVEEELARLAAGRSGRLFLAIECHACFDWLLPVLQAHRARWPDVDVDVRFGGGFSFDALEALQRADVDLVVTSDPEPRAGVTYEPLFDYEALLVMAPTHPLAAASFIAPQDLAGETLLTYPVDRSRLDGFAHFLRPAGVEPRAVRAVDLTAVLLLLVASGRGVAVLPDWVVRADQTRGALACRPLGPTGVRRVLFAALRAETKRAPYLDTFLALARAAKDGRASLYSKPPDQAPDETADAL